MVESPPTSFFIGGVRVNFPMKPYPSQIAMMGQIMRGLNKKENCLLESPTGTGKSLALLCSTLAWQAAEEDKVSRYNSLIDQGITDPDILNRIFGSSGTSNSTQGSNSSLADSQLNETQPTSGASTQRTPSTPNTAGSEGGIAGNNSLSTSHEGGFLRNNENGDSINFREDGLRFRPTSTVNEITNETLTEDQFLNTNVPRKKRTPKIFFGTRTHKQIYQIIRELRKTVYKNVRSAVLGSREHTCIHPVVSKSKSKNEGCKALLENKEKDFCSFYHGVSRIKTHEQLSNLGYPPVWDIEDMVKIGKRIKACPYFAARHLMETAQIVLCPYNYLIDPLIRESMSIDLRKNILVLDEAHNVEDSSRDAASFSLTQDSLLEAKSDLEKLSTYGVKPEMCEPLVRMLSNLCLWMDTHKDNLNDYTEFGKTVKIFSGEEIVKIFSHLDIESKDLSRLEGCLIKLNEDSEDNESYKPSAATSQLLSGVFLILKYMFKNDLKYINDYKVALIKTQTFGARRFVKNADGWIGRKSGPSSDFVYSLNFWCMNPGVAFSELGIMARSVILTSGTLSPMNSFESELGVKFHVKFEANHVISKEQVWIGTISKGPTNHILNATYKHSETLAFQDELGKMILEVCESIPRGILCFLPSYAMLDKLIDRWQRSDIWERIEEVKVPISESRNSDKFESSIKLFYETIEETKYAEEGVNGALFIAVCRGKVSEGLDFADDNARAVITVGIPFPNTKDIQVNLKRQYNDKFSKSKGLLSGAEWYEIQAYRALNQALGRCIRHRYDWGAIILVDERYQQPMLGSSPHNRYVRGLSKWIRSSIHHETCFGVAVSQLKRFSERMIENDRNKKSENQECSDESSKIEASDLKFATPPVFQNGKKLMDDKGKEEPVTERSDNRKYTSPSDILLNVQDGDYKMPSALNISVVTPMTEIPLTPITCENQPSQSPKLVFPITSTQISQVNHSEKLVGYINQQTISTNQFTFTPNTTHSDGNSIILHNVTPTQKILIHVKHNSNKNTAQILTSTPNRTPAKNFKNVSLHNLTSTPNSTSAKNMIGKSKHFPIFESAIKRRKTLSYLETKNFELSNHLPDSPQNLPDVVNISSDDSKNVLSVNKENMPSYSSDDLFGEDEEILKTEVVIKNMKLDESKESTRRHKRKLSKKLSKSKLSNSMVSQMASCSAVGENDSDLEDFNLNTSIIGNQRTAKRTNKKVKQKGVVFSDLE